MVEVDITAEINNEIISAFKRLEGFEKSGKLNQAMLDSSMVVERKAKENLREMVYSQPEIWYRRTGFLMNKTISTGKVNKARDMVSATVGSFVHYAKAVHFGLGKGRNSSPRPYLTKALKESKESILEILKKSIL